MATTLTLLSALFFAAVHLLAGRLRFLDRTPRSAWLSLAGGVSVAYVFLHLLPELGEGQARIERTTDAVPRHLYLIALVGLGVFYGLERAALRDRAPAGSPGSRRDAPTGAPVFWLHVASFTAYNLLIGYILLHMERSPGELLWYVVAMGLHFLVNDFGLREHHRERYEHRGRWILAGAILLGWAAGMSVEIGELALTAILAFLGGGVILNVLKEELPEERQSRFWAFALGGSVYAALLLATA